MTYARIGSKCYLKVVSCVINAREIDTWIYGTKRGLFAGWQLMTKSHQLFCSAFSVWSFLSHRPCLIEAKEGDAEIDDNYWYITCFIIWNLYKLSEQKQNGWLCIFWSILLNANFVIYACCYSNKFCWMFSVSHDYAFDFMIPLLILLSVRIQFFIPNFGLFISICNVTFTAFWTFSVLL